jgi:hypothetical protein
MGFSRRKFLAAAEGAALSDILASVQPNTMVQKVV